ncbi:branched-chain amino acid ABC transporter permease [Brevibacillus sp. H7]|uniref:branched-chain amino acid ABC transporter permease n=1 Tax=Brevibacillus sp. H7 TaxID=3349138 RepID=UPI00382D8A70
MKHAWKRTHWVYYSPLLILLAFLPGNEYFYNLIGMCVIYAIAVTALNITVGYAGQTSLGHGALVGIGAYASALLTANGIPFLLALVCSGLIAGLFGLIIGFPSLKLKGPYLALSTIAFGVVVETFFNQSTDLTQGAMGMTVSSAEIFGFSLDNSQQFLYFLLPFAAFVLITTHHLLDSPVGRTWKAVRGDTTAAGILGIHTAHAKLIAFVYSAMLAGFAGSLWAHKTAFISPESFSFHLSVELLVMVVLGGRGFLIGGIVGAVLLHLSMDQFQKFAFMQENQMVLYGFLIVVLAMFMPKGIIGGLIALRQRIKNREGASHHVSA